MPRFNYVALDARGQEATGLLEAASSSAAISQLRQAGYFPTSVIEEAKSVPTARKLADGQRRSRVRRNGAKKGIVLFQRRKVKSKVLMIFTRQLATLIDSGLPLLRSLNVLAKQERDKVMKKTINKLAESVQSGSTFSDASRSIRGFLTSCTSTWSKPASSAACSSWCSPASPSFRRRRPRLRTRSSRRWCIRSS